jgi:hypothetical protein
MVLLCPYIPTHGTIQENNAENFVMNALDSKWYTQKLKWGNISLAQAFLNQTLLSQQYNTMCQSAQSGLNKSLLWPVILLQSHQDKSALFGRSY